MTSRCVSVTGATGFLGSHIAEAFRARGWAVRAIVRAGNRRPLPAGVDERQVELRDAAALAEACSGSDAIVHAAGLVRARSMREFDAVNVHGTRAVVHAANVTRARLVHISSLAAAGPGTADRPAREDAPPRPVNAYGRSKLAGELVVREAARIPWLILRPSAVYGPGDRGFLPLVRLARRGLFLLAAPASTAFTFVYADDLAEAVVRASEGDVSGEAFFVGHPEPETTEAFLRTLAGHLRRALPPPDDSRADSSARPLRWATWSGRWEARPLIDSSRFAEFRSEGFVCDVSRARERLGFTAAVRAVGRSCSGLCDGIEIEAGSERRLARQFGRVGLGQRRVAEDVGAQAVVGPHAVPQERVPGGLRRHDRVRAPVAGRHLLRTEVLEHLQVALHESRAAHVRHRGDRERQRVFLPVVRVVLEEDPSFRVVAGVVARTGQGREDRGVQAV